MFRLSMILLPRRPTKLIYIMEIPNLRDKAVRQRWRNDTACSDPKVAGDMLLPTYAKGMPDIDDGVYAHMKQLWETGDSTYKNAVLHQGEKK